MEAAKSSADPRWADSTAKSSNRVGQLQLNGPLSWCVALRWEAWSSWDTRWLASVVARVTPRHGYN